AVILAIEAQGFHPHIDPLMDFALDAKAGIVGGAAVMAAVLRVSPEAPNPYQTIGPPAVTEVPVETEVARPPASLSSLPPPAPAQLHPVAPQPYRPLAGELVTQSQAYGGVIVQVALLVKEKITEPGSDIESACFFPCIGRPDQGQGSQ